MRCRQPTLLHRSSGESRKSDDVASGVDVRHGRLKKFIHLQPSSRIRLKAGCRQVKRIRVALPAHSIEKCVTMNALAALEPRRDSIAVLINFYGDDFLSEPKDHFELSQVI